MWPFIASLAILYTQVVGPVATLQLPSDHGGMQLYERSVGGQNSIFSVPAINVEKAVQAIGQIEPKSMKRAVRNLGILTDDYNSLLTDLITHIYKLATKSQNSKDKSMTDEAPFHKKFTTEALLTDLEKINSQRNKGLIEELEVFYEGTEMEKVFTYIRELIEMRPKLEKLGELRDETIKAFGFDEEMDASKIGLPVPTDENPEVYFGLIDSKLTDTKFLVKVESDGETVTRDIIMRSKNGNSYQLAKTTDKTTEDKMMDLYKNLPILKLPF